jgi:acetyl-CoA carboxylase biotin carboxyl carrier protein
MSKPTPADSENLVELFNRSEWEEMHLKTDDVEIFLSNNPQARTPSPDAVAPASVQTQVGPAAAALAVAVPPIAGAVESLAVADGMVAVRAPNLGTFYSAPKPGAPPYVEVGQSISASTEVCLIEVMKLFTPVKAGVDGVVRKVCANDGDMIEYEQVLVIIEPAI